VSFCRFLWAFCGVQGEIGGLLVPADATEKKLFTRNVLNNLCQMPYIGTSVLKVNIFRFKMQNDLIWAYNQMEKKLSAPQKKAQNRPLGNYRVCPNSVN
jgi:hypothetical protein